MGIWSLPRNDDQGVICVFYFPLGQVELYIVFMCFPLPRTLVETLAKNLLKNLVINVAKNWVGMRLIPGGKD